MVIMLQSSGQRGVHARLWAVACNDLFEALFILGCVDLRASREERSLIYSFLFHPFLEHYVFNGFCLLRGVLQLRAASCLLRRIGQR